MLWSKILERVSRLDEQLPATLRNPQFITVFVGALFLGVFVKLRKVIIIFVMSVCPSVRTEQLGSNLDGFSCNLILEYSSKMCPERSSLNKIRQKKTMKVLALFMVHFMVPKVQNLLVLKEFIKA